MPRSDPRALPAPHGFRPDVHALRALAVALVLGYHLAGAVGSGLLPGGFVGVDVFFVVSGFLITGLLLRELDTTGRVRLAAFWARRARRLAPAALLVLVVAGAASLALLPREDWPRLGAELAASAVAAENWALAALSVDYLAQGDAATPFQHYWSLGVEEQFYLVWPLLLVAGWRLLRRIGLSRRTGLLVLIAAVTAASFVASVVLTGSDPGPAYVLPHTRAWELGVGALLAVAPGALPARLRMPVAAVGWLGIAASAVLLGDGTPYPGVAALAPVAATAAVIAGRTAAGAAARIESSTPVRMLGDVSYPLYLWHWPVIVLLPHLVDLPAARLAIVATLLSLALAVATHRFVELPVQRGALSLRPPRRTLAITAAAVAVVLLGPAIGWGALTRQVDDDRAAAASWLRAEPGCFGAAALDDDRCPVAGDEGVTPSTATAEFDVSADWDACRARTGPARDCVVGVPGGTRVALIGDSHAHHWVTAVEAIAEQQGWEVTLLFAGGCDFSRVVWRDRSAADTERCADWNERVDRRLAAAEPFDYVLTAARADGDRPVGDDPTAAAVAGYDAAWRPLLERGSTVIAIRDTPTATGGTRGCVAAHPTDTERCAVAESRALADPDWLIAAARRTDGVRVVDLTDRFCLDGRCPPVIGNVLVLRDTQHLTATYARTLGPALWSAIAGGAEQGAG